MGIHHLVLTSAQKVPKDYFGSHLFRKPLEIRKLLIEGLCQAGDVRIPTVTVVNRLKPFLEDDLDDLFPKERWARVIAHPLRKDNGDNNKPLRMDDISFPSSSSSNRDNSGEDVLFPPRVVLAVGPEVSNRSTVMTCILFSDLKVPVLQHILILPLFFDN